jgi:hypothetical protein
MLEAPGDALCLQLLATRVLPLCGLVKSLDFGLGVLQTSSGRGWGQCRALLLKIIRGLEDRILLAVQHTWLGRLSARVRKPIAGQDGLRTVAVGKSCSQAVWYSGVEKAI